MITNICGTGFGLPISKALTDLLGGQMSQTSAGSMQSQFFSIAHCDNDNITFKTSNERGENDFSWQDKTVLIAEDEEINYLYLKAALSKTKAIILRAKNGKEAVEAVKCNPGIDIVLMDIKMPEMNGIEATRIIKSIDKDMIVIAQTAYVMEEDKLMYEKAGCNDYLAKPITKDKLLQTMARYLQ